MTEPVRSSTNSSAVSAVVKKATIDPADTPQKETESQIPEEVGGPKGPEPTRYGDWEQKGRCTDF